MWWVSLSLLRSSCQHPDPTSSGSSDSGMLPGLLLAKLPRERELAGFSFSFF